MVGLGIKKLRQAKSVDEIIVSTESELVARIAKDFGAIILRRPKELADDNVPSVPVFQHILKNYPADIHVNFNVNFPMCSPSVIDRTVDIASKKGEALSNPYAVWAQTKDRLENYGDFFATPQNIFDDEDAGIIDIHTEEDWLKSLRIHQGPIEGW